MDARFVAKVVTGRSYTTLTGLGQMSLSELTSPQAVRKALDEFDHLGRTAFLNKYGFGQAHEYFVQHNGRLYDSKAIAGAAFGFQHVSRGPLKSGDFSGGEVTVRAKLEELGFTVVVLD